MNTHKVLALLVLVLLTGNIFAQNQSDNQLRQTDRDRNRFMLLLEQETATSEGEQSTGFFTLVPERLPEWVNHVPTSEGNTLFILGISDPGMDEETGYRVAESRLKTVYAMLTGAVVSNMRDYYTRERHSTYANAFIDYTQYKNTVTANPDNIEIIESHVTKYGETILLGVIDVGSLNINKQGNSQIEISAGIMSNARRVGTRTEMVSTTNITTTIISNESDEKYELSYTTHAINRRVNSETKLNGETISSLPALSLRYAVENQPAEDSLYTAQINYSLRNGLWYAYLTAIMFELADMVHGSAINISNIHEVFDHVSQNLTREIVSKSIRCKQQQIMIKSNNLYFQCGSYYYLSPEDTKP